MSETISEGIIFPRIRKEVSLEIEEKAAIADAIYARIPDDMKVVEKYFDWRDKRVFEGAKVSTPKYYCYTCNRYLDRKEVRKHTRRGHEVLRIRNFLMYPLKYTDTAFSEKTERYAKYKSLGEEYYQRCFYCLRTRPVGDPDFPLISVELYQGPKGWVRVSVCPVCYYERFGRYKAKSRFSQKILEIQKNYVMSLKKVDPERLNEIHIRIISELKARIRASLLLRLTEKQRPYIDELVEERLRKALPRYVIL